jgi:transposase
MTTKKAPAQSQNKRDWKEATPQQREQAATLFAKNMVQADVARQVGVSKSTICRWYKDWGSRNQQEVGPAGRRGGVCKLSKEQLEQLKRELLRGPRAHGYLTELWTLSRIRLLVEKLFGVSYRTGSIWYLMRQLGFSPQKPVKRGMERDDAAIEEWKQTNWRAIHQKGGS